jgi:5-methylcytosine-specific restriction protein A
LVEVLRLYLSEKSIARKNPALLSTAQRLGRTPGSVYARLQNFKTIDPGYEGVGLTAGRKVCEPIWRKYSERILRDLGQDDRKPGIGWRGAVLAIICENWSEEESFRIEDLHKYELDLAKIFPRNQHIRAKVRQTTQQLRDDGWLEFVDNKGTYVRTARSDSLLYPEIVSPTSITEGACKLVSVNAYERSSKARQACIKHHGCVCSACGLNFADLYGERGAGFIHVHHTKPLAALKEEYVVDPIKDLVPVCPNCHAMLHRGSELLSVSELRDIMASQQR